MHRTSTSAGPSTTPPASGSPGAAALSPAHAVDLGQVHNLVAHRGQLEALDYIADADETIRQPVLIHHGTADLRIPLETSLDLQATNPDLIQLITVEGAGHVESYDIDRQSYVDLCRFLADLG